MSMKKYHIHISSKHNLLNMKLDEVWQYRDLILLFAKKNFTVAYKQTILGPLWLFVNPLLSSLIYMVLFGEIAGLSTDGTPKMLFYLCGTALWNFFSSCLSGNASTFVNNANLFGKVYFPRLTIPIANMLSAMVKFLIQLLLIIAVDVYYLIEGMVTPNWGMWSMIPIVLVQLGILGMSVGIIISSLTTKYRDLSVLVTFGVQFWMYMTPVVYPFSQLPAGFLQVLIRWNPVTGGMELFRYAVTGVGTVHLYSYLSSWVCTIAMMLIGIMIFNKVERNFMDTV